MPETPISFQHPVMNRRSAVQSGAIGLLGLGLNHLTALQAEASPDLLQQGSAKSCIYIFLSGGLGQHDSFDMKPEAPEDIRGEFQPIATKTPGIQICEHLPMLAARSQLWALCRSLTHPSNDHSAGHHIMLTGRSELPRGFAPDRPSSTDWPSMASIIEYLSPSANNLPPAIMLPERLVHSTGRVIPGQFAGEMGRPHDPWFIEASPFHSTSYGAYPQYHFDHQERGKADDRRFEAPCLSVQHDQIGARLPDRLELLRSLESECRSLEQSATARNFDRYRQGVIAMLTEPSVCSAFDVTNADDSSQERYGKNSFGWSLFMAKRLVEAGVRLVQVNLGNNETWDTHGEAFPHLKNNLFPPTDRAVSALLDDLNESGLLESTLVVMAGEFGRTPKIKHLPQHYKLPGRDHWGAVQSVFFAGGGVQGGRVIGASDRMGAFPADNPQKPENMAATIYSALGIPQTAHWRDAIDRPHPIYFGEPIPGLM